VGRWRIGRLTQSASSRESMAEDKRHSLW
jgi:hypothetical protein